LIRRYRVSSVCPADSKAFTVIGLPTRLGGLGILPFVNVFEHAYAAANEAADLFLAPILSLPIDEAATLTPQSARSFLLCSVLFCSVLFCSVLFCSVLFCSVLFCSLVFFLLSLALSLSSSSNAVNNNIIIHSIIPFSNITALFFLLLARTTFFLFFTSTRYRVINMTTVPPPYRMSNRSTTQCASLRRSPNWPPLPIFDSNQTTSPVLPETRPRKIRRKTLSAVR
jgi:hypothetical protein